MNDIAKSKSIRILKILAIVQRDSLKLINNFENNKLYEELTKNDPEIKEELIDFMNKIQSLGEVEYLNLLCDIENLVETKKIETKKIEKFENLN